MGSDTTLGSFATTGLVCKGYAPHIIGNIAAVSATRLVPGFAWVLAGSTNSCTLHNGSSDALKTPLWLDFRPRTTSTFGEVDIDTAEAAVSADVHLLDPYNGSNDVEWWAMCIDMSASYYGGQALKLNAGSARLHLVTQATLSSSQIAARIAPGYTYTNGDEMVKVCKP